MARCITRRLLLPLLGVPTLVHGQSATAPPQGSSDQLPARGAPTGRIGGATRGTELMTLDLIAPERGAGRATTGLPRLHYRVSGATGRGLRATLTLRSQARPLADQALPPPPGAGVHGFTLAPSTQLVPGETYIWSVTLAVDPRSPSRDIVASALLVHAPADAALLRRVEALSPPQRVEAWLRENYFYDAAAAAMAARGQDGGAALAQLLRSVNL
jgi:hypothetical protein